MRLDVLKAMNAARRERRAGAVVTRLSDGDQRFVEAEALGEDPLAGEIETAAAAGQERCGRRRRRGAISSPCRRRRRD